LNRVPYRRVTPPRNGTASQIEFNRRKDRPASIGETIIVQAIISGLLMAVVLIICIVNIAPLVSLRGRLGQALDGATTVDEFANDIRQFRDNWLVTPHIEPTDQIEPPEPEEPPAPPLIYSPTIPLTVQEESINPQIPGPSMGPGLWD